MRWYRNLMWCLLELMCLMLFCLMIDGGFILFLVVFLLFLMICLVKLGWI